MYYFVYYIDTLIVTFFYDFLKMSDHFPEISKDSPKTCSKIAKAFKKDLKIFRSYTNELKINFYYIKVSGIASGNKLIKTIRYPHM